MNLELNLWTVIAVVFGLLALIEYANIKLAKRDANRIEMEVRREYLNKVNNLPGDEAEYVRFMNSIWGEIYEDPNSWEYPDQVVRHVNQIKTERDFVVASIRRFVNMTSRMEPFSHFEHRSIYDNFVDILNIIEPGWKNKNGS